MEPNPQTNKAPGKFALFKQSFAILQGDKQLALFPIAAAVISALVAIAFAVIFFAVASVLPEKSNQYAIFAYAMLFLFYLVEYYVLIYFNVGLAASVLDKYRGTNTSFKAGLAQAGQKKRQIFGYAMLAAIVGWLLKIVAERFKGFGAIMSSLLGATWSLATVFIAPVIITTQLSPIAAVKESARTFIQVWGRTILGNVGFALIALIGTVVCLLPVAAGYFLKDDVVLVVGGAVTLVGLVILSIIVSACAAIYRTALFYYATNKKVPAGFGKDLPMSVKVKA